MAMSDKEIWDRAWRLARKLVVKPSGMFVRMIANELKNVQKECSNG